MRIRCIECLVEFDESFFHLRGRYAYCRRRSLRCKACEQELRDKEKGKNRFISKARSVIARHAQKYVEMGWAKDLQDFKDQYEWDLQLIAHDMEHASKNGCAYCSVPYGERKNGLADLTLDIVNPEIKPYYRTNVEFCCATCNKEKQRTPPELWSAHRANWKYRELELKRRIQKNATVWDVFGWKVNEASK